MLQEEFADCASKLLVWVPFPITEVWAQMKAQVEELAGQARLQIRVFLKK